VNRDLSAAMPFSLIRFSWQDKANEDCCQTQLQKGLENGAGQFQFSRGAGRFCLPGISVRLYCAGIGPSSASRPRGHQPLCRINPVFNRPIKGGSVSAGLASADNLLD
jgi:hypothetical protein